MTCPGCGQEQRQDRRGRVAVRVKAKEPMIVILPRRVRHRPRHLGQTHVIWQAYGRFTRLEGDPSNECAAALAASRRLRPE